MQTFKKLLFLLNYQERKKAILLLLMIIVMAMLELAGVASILPFIAVLTNPSLIETNYILNNIFVISKQYGVETNQQFLIILGIFVFALMVVSITFKILTSYFLIRFVEMRNYSISKRLIEGYLHQPYSWFLSRHSADLGKTILSEVGSIVASGISPLLELIAKGIVAISLIALLILVDPNIALIVSISLSGAYLVIFFLFKKYLSNFGKKRLINNQIRFKTINEAFSAAKEIKLGSLENVYIKNFLDSSKIFARTRAHSEVIAQLPRYILEAIAFGGILLVTIYIMSKKGSFSSAIPLISLYAFAGYRLMPALQQIYVSFTKITFIGPSLDKLISDIKNLKVYHKDHDQKKFNFKNKITLNNIHYNYPKSSISALKGVNLTIPINSKVGIIGVTGSGKTTIVDIILGLLEPQKGSLMVDEKLITKNNLSSWQQSLGYIPQQIFLSDDTVIANIAFGVDTCDVDFLAVERAAKIANLHEFIINELPDKYQTSIGERGVRLSGGQRQRVGIARALYHKPKVLVLDEATSALDNETEKSVIDEINKIGEDITIILIAHRLNTVKNCDIIFKLDNGKILEKGTFTDLFKDSKIY